MRSIINLYNLDCMEAMRGMKDDQFDLAICDPPYGIKVNHNMGRRAGERSSGYKPVIWDNEPPTLFFFNELMRVSINQIIWGANHFISKIPIDSPCWLLWDKGFSSNITFAQFELAWTSFNSTCKKYDISSNQQFRKHPTQKSIILYKWLLQNYAKEGDKILDTHLGSGSIAIACWDLRYDLEAYEIDKDYYDAACKRFDMHCRQLQLF